MTDNTTHDWRERITREIRNTRKTNKSADKKRPESTPPPIVLVDTTSPTEEEIDRYDVCALLDADLSKIKDETTRYVVRIVQKAYRMGQSACPACMDRPIRGNGRL